MDKKKQIIEELTEFATELLVLNAELQDEDVEKYDKAEARLARRFATRISKIK